MMDERELDRAIDAAAGGMMAREPSRSLGYNVMARVRERNVRRAAAICVDHGKLQALCCAAQLRSR